MKRSCRTWRSWREPEIPRPRRLFAGTGWFEHGSVAFIAGNDAIELLEVLHFFEGHTQFLDFKSSRVVNHTSLCFGLGMVAGKTVVGINRRGQVVHFISRWNRDFKAVCVLHGPLEFDREFARLLGLENSRRQAAYHSRAQQEQIAGILGVAVRLERVVEAEGLIGVLKIYYRGMRNSKTGERIGEQALDRLDAVNVLGHGAQSPTFRRGAVTQSNLLDFALQCAGGVEGQFGGALDAVHVRG